MGRLYFEITSNLQDETQADDKYEKLIKEIENDECLSDEERALMTGIVFKIKTDEGTHKVLLEIMKDVLENKQVY